MENSQELLKKALQLRAAEKFFLIEGLLRSLDEPHPELDEVWMTEAGKRLKAYREGRLTGIAMETIFSEEHFS
jgi:hypothetical protein